MLQNRAGDALIPEVGLAKNKTQKSQTVSTGACSYQFGRFRLQVAENGNMSLRTNGQDIGLTTGELTILRVLLENRGQFVKTRTLLDCVTQSPKASENVVHGAVRQLRRTLNDVDLIRTERSKGYCFTGNVTLAADEDPGVADQIAANLSGSGYQIETANRRQHPFLIVSLLVGTAVLLLPFGLAFAAGSWKSVTKQIGFIQALMILIAIGYDYFLASDPRPKDTDKETRRAQIAVQQFRRSWRLLLASWCGLYVTLLLSQGLSWSTDSAASHWQTLQVITTFLNNSSALMLVMCYLVLNRPTVIDVAGREVESVPLARGMILVAGFGLLEAALVVYLEKFGHAAYTAVVLFGADLLSGIVGGIAMALFISRLDSRLLGASRLLPVIPIVLYFYVVIQPFYPLLNWTYPLGSQVPEHFDLWIMQLAFVLKSIMYIYVTELLKTERLLFYMISARRVYENAATEWHNFSLTGANITQQ